jgi:nicotinamide-nucleotide amidase
MEISAALITIGDELLNGQVVNTNASYLCSKLPEIGISADRIVTVHDNEKDILKEFRSTFPKYNVIIVSGGLGPTHDDITKTCISKFFKSKLVLDKTVLKHVRSMFRRRKVPMPESNLEQAMIPDISTALSRACPTR